METQNKICSQCEIKLSIDNFYRDRTSISKISYRSKCKKCCKINQSKRIKRDKNLTITDKKCSICSEVKLISCFYKNTRYKDGYFKFCIDCHKDKVKNSGNNTTIKRTVEYMKEYNKKRYQDPIFKLKHTLRSSIASNLKRQDTTVKKQSRTLVYVGCEIEFFKKWIDYNFDGNMTWDNHGEYWHLDHIKPCASFNLTAQEEIFKCYNWTNYRPCEKKANIAKSDKIDNNLIAQYIDIKNIFLSTIKYNVESEANKYILLPVDESSTVLINQNERRELTGNP
jgi:hypothetical protein